MHACNYELDAIIETHINSLVHYFSILGSGFCTTGHKISIAHQSRSVSYAVNDQEWKILVPTFIIHNIAKMMSHMAET